jgi:hypothetical protein
MIILIHILNIFIQIKILNVQFNRNIMLNHHSLLIILYSLSILKDI